MSERILMALGLSLAISACSGGEPDTETEAAPAMEAAETAPAETNAEDSAAAPSLEEVVADASFRSEKKRARDDFRHPVETLEFFGLEPDMTVVEIAPGGGWYSDILVPYVGLGGGTYIAGHTDPANGPGAAKAIEAFKSRYMTGEYGDVQLAVFSSGNIDLGDPGSADMVLTFRNVHNWIGARFDQAAFNAFYEVLEPGGVLGVVEHRLPEDREGEAAGGYVKESKVIALAETAGFELDAKSEVNANAADDADHPFGVWTLPPTGRTTDRDGNMPEGFDPEVYQQIGESDRMTLRFVKPAE